MGDDDEKSSEVMKSLTRKSKAIEASFQNAFNSLKDSIKIFGNPDINLKKKITIKNFLKDHRVFMSSVIAALSFGGEWHIHDKNSIKTSFPDFLKILKNLQT